MPEQDSGATNGHEPRERELRSRLRLPAQKLDDGEPPRPADNDQLRALNQGKLDPSTRQEVLDLIAHYREWHEAYDRLLEEEAGADE